METVESIRLVYTGGSSNKFYRVWISNSGGNYSVHANNGRIGETGQFWDKGSGLSFEKAKKIYNGLIKKKMNHPTTPYWEDTSTSNVKKLTTPSSNVTTAIKESAENFKTSLPLTPQSGIIPQLLNEIEETELQAFLDNPDWWAQEKHDGKRMILHFTNGSTPHLLATNRKGKECGCNQGYLFSCNDIANGQYDDVTDFVLDGESIGDTFYVFDLLEISGANLREQSYAHRYTTLKGLIENTSGIGLDTSHIQLVQTAKTPAEKKALLAELQKHEREGIVLKRKTAKYQSGRPNSGGDQLKYKFYATCSCIVERVNTQRSVALVMSQGQDNWEGIPVGNCTIPPNKEIPKEGAIVEIRYLYAYKGGSLYQPTYLGERDDLELNDCNIKQLKYKSESGPVKIEKSSQPQLKRKILWQ